MTTYVGRFAPSPTGRLHMGSLVAAVGSFVHARSSGGRWLVRVEDLDPPREMPGASAHILETLSIHGLNWDEEVMYQSQQLQRYQSVIEQLLEEKQAYYCQCTRSVLLKRAAQGAYGIIYPGTCRHLNLQRESLSVRIKTQPGSISFTDRRLGHYQQSLQSEIGDFIIKRSDGLFAYQLAVVIDDEYQGVTDIVRGGDLLDNTPRQIHLQQLLGYSTPGYLHLPVVTDGNNQKLSKQTHARPLDRSIPDKNLIRALRHLGFGMDSARDMHSVEQILNWSIEENQRTQPLEQCL